MRNILLASLFIISAQSLQSQCLPPVNCTPGGPTNSNAALFEMGIRRVQLNNIDNPSGFVQVGNAVTYEDFTCTDSTDLMVGTTYSIAVRTNGVPSTANENVRVWIDLNNDSSFSASELVFSSNDQQVHSGNINIPASSVLNTPLRMRVAAEWIGATNPIPTPCGDREYSQVEDYKVTLLPNPLPPSTDFIGNPQVSCNGVVQFQDLSINGPTAWFWDFGDGAISNLQNPQHTYAGQDTFDVTLITINANGSDTLVKPQYIIRTGLNPIAPSCTPITNAYCCSYGITNFQFENISNSSADAAVGYEDFACSDFTSVVEGLSYQASFTTNPSAPSNIKMYLDVNNNGSFEDAGELLYSASAVSSPTVNVIIPTAKVSYSTPLRMRIMTDAVGSTFNSCTNLTRGQAEDYTILIQPNPNPPTALFTDNQVNTCQGTIQFTDLSLNAPFSWFWDFGDGTTDTVQNPVHSFAPNATYTVKLVVQNANGADSSTANYTVNDGAIPPQCIPGSAQTFFPLDIEEVIFAGISNLSPNPGSNFEPYEDFACDFVGNVTQGQGYNFTVETRSPVTPSDIRAWLDFNNDGAFTNNELILSSDNSVVHTQFVSIPTTSNIVTGQALRLRIASDFINAPNGPVSCGNLEFGQTEDYSIIVSAPATAPDADFTASAFSSCNGVINFTDQSGFSPNSWTWDFGDGNASTNQNPSHTYTSVGSYFVELIACNSFGCDTIQKTINITSLTGTKPANCTPTSASVNNNIGIFNVTISNLNVSSNSLSAYSDYACSYFAELLETQSYQLDVETGAFNNQTVEAWIDWNNNGVFTSNEKVMSTSGFNVQSSIVIIDPNAVKNQFLRLRVISSSTSTGGAPLDPCADIILGEIEDYGVLIRSANAIPVADFTSNSNMSCNGEVTFENTSYYNPNSYLWDFGDGSNSIEKNPTHKYNAPGSYTVKLRAQNGNGSDSITKTNYVVISNVQGPVEADCYPGTQFNNPDFGITDVQFASINNSNSIHDGYENYSCSDTTWVMPGQVLTLAVRTESGERATVRAFIDYNNDGEFQVPQELILASNNIDENHSSTVNIPTDAVENALLRMRVWCDSYDPAYSNDVSCLEPRYGQVEDFGVFINDPNSLNKEYDNLFNIYPNPSEGLLNLKFNKKSSSGHRVSVYNEIGVRLENINISADQFEYEIDLRHLNSGVYLIKIESSEFTRIEKIIKK